MPTKWPRLQSCTDLAALLCVANRHDRWNLTDSYFRTPDRRRHSVDCCRQNRLIERTIHDDSAGRHPDARAQIDRYYFAKRLHIEVERPVFGAEVRDAYSGNLFDPLVSDTGTNHESAVALALVG